MLPPVAYQNQFNQTRVRAYWIPDAFREISSCLSAQEKSVVSAIISPSMQHQKMWSFVLTRLILGEALRQEPQTILINRENKPTLVEWSDVHFNVSHSQNMWVIAWSFEEVVGIDVQKIDATINYQSIMRQFFSASERARVKTVQEFFDLWTQKEAALKLQGLGVAHMPKISTESVRLIPLSIDPTFKAHLALHNASCF